MTAFKILTKVFICQDHIWQAIKFFAEQGNFTKFTEY